MADIVGHAPNPYEIRDASLRYPIDVADYLFRRLYEVGVRSVHGVSGDHNYKALDYLAPAGLSWVNNCNALNAGYAADGYARINGIAALVTSFGAGELSALNAIAGAYAEYVPVVHIVGTPAVSSQANGMLLDHALGNGNSSTFADMSKAISCHSAHLNDPTDIATQIDHAIRECWIQSRPVYITLPVDMIQKKIKGERLRVPIDLSFAPNDEEKEDYVTEVVLRYLHAATNPVILVDACAIRHRALVETHALIQRSGIPTFVSPMGKGAVNEAIPNYSGVYAGNGSAIDVRERVESADLVLSIGAVKSDFDTAGFSYRLSQLSTIDFHSDHVRVNYSEYRGVRMNGVLRKLVERMSNVSWVPGPNPKNSVPHGQRDSTTPDTLTNAWLWPTVGRWLQQNDIVITEGGTASYGIWETRFPANVTAISQVLWQSSGSATAACQGAALAASELMRQEPGRRHRTILFVGDGAFQQSAQSLSDIIRLKLNPIIFLINNEGCTTNRLLRPGQSEDRSNIKDIQPWRYKDLLSAFGAMKGEYQSCTLRTKKQVAALFADEFFNEASCLQFVELLLPRDDAPAAISRAVQRNAAAW